MSNRLRTIYSSPEEVQRKYIDAGGYKTHYLEAGDESSYPLVLVHGGNFQMGLAAERWYPNILPLADNFHVFAVDELGGGYTDPPHDISDIGDVKVRAEHVLAFIEKLDLGPVHLVGQSQGAWIIAYIAVKRPDLVQELVLIDSASLSLPDGGMNQANIAKSFSSSFLPGTMVVEGLTPSPESVRKWMSTMLYPDTELDPEFVSYGVGCAERWLSVWDAPWRQFWADDGTRNRAQYQLDGIHLNQHLHKLKRPPLIIWGRNTVKGLQSGLDFFAEMPDAELHIYDKANHFLWIDQPERFNRSVSSFLLARTPKKT